MSEILIDWSTLFPILWEVRLLAFAVGIAMFIHSACMAGFMPQNSPWSISLIVAFSAAAGMGMIVGGIAGSFPMILLASLVSSATLTTMALWLWSHGMHVSKFIDKNYGNS